MKVTRKDFIVLLMQMGFFAVLIGLPMLMALFWGASVSFNLVLRITLRWMLPMMAVYLINYYVLVPFLYYKHHRWLFVFVNVLLIALINNFIFFGYKIGPDGMIISPATIPEMGRPMYYSNAIIPVALHIFAAIAALGVRHLSRLHEVELKMKEQEQKTTQAELAWLKNQLYEQLHRPDAVALRQEDDRQRQYEIAARGYGGAVAVHLADRECFQTRREQ